MSARATDAPRIWIGCLAAYNEGHLHGEWFDAAQDEDDLWACVKKVIDSSPAFHPEEWFVADNEGFHPYSLGEYPSMKDVSRIANLIEQHGVSFAVFLSHDEDALRNTDDEHDLEERYHEAYRGEWDSEEEFARDFVDDCGLPGVGYVKIETGPDWTMRKEKPWSEVLDDLDSLLDWETVTRYVMEGFDSTRHDGKTYVFSTDY